MCLPDFQWRLTGSVDWRIVPFDRAYDRHRFGYGEPILDSWLRDQAGQSASKRLSRFWLLMPQDDEPILGFYTRSSGRLPIDSLPTAEQTGYPRNVGLPSILIGQLAVDLSLRGHGLGSFPAQDALALSEWLSQKAGVAAAAESWHRCRKR